MDLSKPYISRRLAELIQDVPPDDREAFIAEARRAPNFEQFEAEVLPKFPKVASSREKT